MKKTVHIRPATAELGVLKDGKSYVLWNRSHVVWHIKVPLNLPIGREHATYARHKHQCEKQTDESDLNHRLGQPPFQSEITRKGLKKAYESHEDFMNETGPSKSEVTAPTLLFASIEYVSVSRSINRFDLSENTGPV